MKPFILHVVRVVIVSALVLDVNTLGHSQPRVQPDFRHGFDSLRLKGVPHDLLNDRLRRTGFQSEGGTLPNKVSSPRSLFYVIDTAVVWCHEGGLLIRGDTARHLYSYNASAKRIADLTQTFTAEQWVDSLRHTNSYDANDNMLSSSQELWSNGQWVPSGRCVTYTYDASGNLLSELRQLDDVERFTYTYDENGNMLTKLHEDIYLAEWRVINRWSYTFDAQGNMLSEIYGNNNQGRRTFTYDAQGNRLSMLGESAETGKWVTWELETYTYDALGNMLTMVRDDSVYIDVGHSLTTYTYNTDGNRVSQSFELWVNGEWNSQWRNTYTYDAQGNMLTKIWATWWDGQYWDVERWTYTYDAQGNLSSLWYHRMEGENASWIPSYNTFWSITDSSGNSYGYYGYNVTFTHKFIVTGIASESGTLPATYSLSQNYPNPFNPSTEIRYELPHASRVTLKVYNTLGQLVATLANENKSAGAYTVQFDAGNLASGVYYYRLAAGAFNETKKLLLIR
jgi:YD repeat-containing protein